MGIEQVSNFRYNLRRRLITSNSLDKCIIFKEENGSILEVSRMKSDFSKILPMQYDASFNYDGSLLATGGSDGKNYLLKRLWTVNGSVKQEGQVKIECSIKNLDFHLSNNLVKDYNLYIITQLVVIGGDNFFRIINYTKNYVLQKIAPVEYLSSTLAYHSSHFSLDEAHFFTLQNSLKSQTSFLTIWKVNQNKLESIETKKIANSMITTSCLSQDGMFLGVGCQNGQTKVINLRYYDIESEAKFLESEVRTICFSRDSRFLLSATDNNYHFLPNKRPEGWFSRITKLWVLIMVIVYLINLFGSIF